MSGAYWFLRRAQEGIACLEKSIKFFEQTEHKLNSVIAYNNLGINLMHARRLDKAEAMMNRALEIALEGNHAHVAGIFDSIGELKLMRGELDEARELLNKASVLLTNAKKNGMPTHALHNLARCLLAQNAT